MKFKFTLLFAVLTISTFAQDKAFIDGKGFKSCFSKMKEGNFPGLVGGILKINLVKGDSLTILFNSDKALLSIVPDEPNEVYDVSFKRYEVESTDKKVQMIYQTYARANSFQIQLDGNTFILNGIDGSCDAVINGLEYEYLNNKQYEYLLLHFTNDVGLRVPKSGNASAFFIKKGSMLMFIISR